MKFMTIKSMFLLTALFLLAGCFVSQATHQISVDENKRLREENMVLQNEIEEYKETPNFYFENGIKFKDIDSKKSYDFFMDLHLKFPNNDLSEKAFLYLKEFQKENYQKINKAMNEETTIEGKLNTLNVGLYSYRNYLSEKGIKLIEDEKKILKTELEAEKLIDELNKNITISYDEFTKITFYETTRNTTYERTNNISFNIEVYMGKKDGGDPYFRLRSKYLDKRSSYHDTNWIFYDKVQILAENNAHITINTKHPNKQTDNGSYGLKEWSDDNVSTDDVLKFTDAKKVKVRFTGKYSYDFEMTDNQLKALFEIITKYKQL